MENKMKLELLSISASEFVANATIMAFVAQANTSQFDVEDITTALSEAVKNCIDHAYPEKPGPIYITAFLHNSNVIINVKDRGIGIKDIGLSMSDIYSSKSDTHSGLGFTIMNNFMDRVIVKSTFGKGTTVTLKKRIHVT